MKARDYRPELTAIVETFDRLGTFTKKGLTLAIGIDAAQYTAWKESLEGDAPIHPNQKTRDSIGSLVELDRDYRLDGIEWALDQMGSMARDLELAAEVRRTLRIKLMEVDGVDVIRAVGSKSTKPTGADPSTVPEDDEKLASALGKMSPESEEDGTGKARGS